jgi:hypothetical protein
MCIGGAFVCFRSRSDGLLLTTATVLAANRVVGDAPLKSANTFPCSAEYVREALKPSTK